MRDGKRLGSLFCLRLDAETARLRMFFLEPDARGTGLGRAMMQRFLDYAKQAGYWRVTLWTDESHHGAYALYASFGFAMTESRAVRSFGPDMVEQTWEIAL